MTTAPLRPRHPIVARLLGACLLLSACAGDDPEGSATDTSASGAETETESESAGACELAAAGVTIPDAPYFAAGYDDPASQLDAASCEVTAAGFACAVDGGELPCFVAASTGELAATGVAIEETPTPEIPTLAEEEQPAADEEAPVARRRRGAPREDGPSTSPREANEPTEPRGATGIRDEF